MRTIRGGSEDRVKGKRRQKKGKGRRLPMCEDYIYKKIYKTHK